MARILSIAGLTLTTVAFCYHGTIGGRADVPLITTAVSIVNQTEKAVSKEVTKGWMVTHTEVGDVTEVLKNYDVGIDRTVSHKGKASACVKSKGANEMGAAVFMQVIRAETFRGKRVHFSGYVKGEKIEKGAVLWMRVDAEDGGILSFDNMWNRKVEGTKDWSKYEIVLDVPSNSAAIYFGFLLIGKGQVWADDFRFEVVGEEVKSTNTWDVSVIPDSVNSKIKEMHVTNAKKWLPNASLKPINLGFEE